MEQKVVDFVCKKSLRRRGRSLPWGCHVQPSPRVAARTDSPSNSPKLVRASFQIRRRWSVRTDAFLPETPCLGVLSFAV